MRLNIVIPLALSFLLASCSNMRPYYPLHSSASSPTQNDTVVIIALVGEGDIMQIHSGYFNEFKVPKRKGRKVNILAYRLKPDMTSFGITNIDLYAKKAGDGTVIRKYIDKDWHKIKVTGPGIYHYGTIFSSNKKLAVTDKIDRNLLLLAKRKYSHLYKTLGVAK